jgi:hypothetical protein
MDCSNFGSRRENVLNKKYEFSKIIEKCYCVINEQFKRLFMVIVQLFEY